MSPSSPSRPRNELVRFTHAGDLTGEKPTMEFHEVRIPVPWGHISGKWYGPQNVRPIVGLHGWQDNAGTFDTLAPLLPKHIGFLALDLPGHGLSSRLPDGMYYNSVDNISVILLIMKQYKWEKISIIGHSMSSILGFVFAAIYPEKVDLLIGIDALKPHQRPLPKIIKTLATRMEESIIEDERNRGEYEPPSYTYEELIEKLHFGTIYSVQKDKCHHLLARNIQKSTKYPEKYFFTRDRRLKYYNYVVGSQELCVEMAKRINVPYLYIKASESTYFEDKRYFDEVIEVLRQKPTFDFQTVEGSHHVHLNNPERCSGIINAFICKHRPEGARSKL